MSIFTDAGAQIAASLAPQEDFLEVEVATETVVSPALGGTRMLANGPLVEENLTLTGAGGTIYRYAYDYAELPEGGFENVAIPPGITLTAEYFYYSEGPLASGGSAQPSPEKFRFEGSLVQTYIDPVTGETVVLLEPKTEEPEPWRAATLQNGWTNVAGYNPAGFYRHRGRVYLRGRITGGAVAVGTVLFSDPPGGYRPANTEGLPARSDAGPVQVEVSPAGVVGIAEGPFEAGSGWLSLDGLSYRALTGYGARYPATSRYPNTNRYPNGG